jgi:hypothetical protein
MTGNLNTPSINGGGIAGFNNIINGGFDFWQRGTSFSLTASTFTADRFYLASTSSSSASRSTDVPANNYSKYSLSATSDQWANGVFTLIENGANLVNGRTYTFSAWVKGPSGKTANISIGWHGESASYTFTGNWQYISRTTTFSESFRSTNGGGDTLYLHFVRNVLGGASQLVSGNTVLITQCKMEEGTQATPFVRHGITIPGELAACQRYYWRDSSANSSTAYKYFANVVDDVTGTGSVLGTYFFPVTMRTSPSFNATGSFMVYRGGISAATSVGSDGSSTNTMGIVAGGLTSRSIGFGGNLRANNNNTCYLEFNAEL